MFTCTSTYLFPHKISWLGSYPFPLLKCLNLEISTNESTRIKDRLRLVTYCTDLFNSLEKNHEYKHLYCTVVLECFVVLTLLSAEPHLLKAVTLYSPVSSWRPAGILSVNVHSFSPSWTSFSSQDVVNRTLTSSPSLVLYITCSKKKQMFKS